MIELTPEMISKFSRRATRASAALEGREVPADYVRTPEVIKILEGRKHENPNPL